MILEIVLLRVQTAIRTHVRIFYTLHSVHDYAYTSMKSEEIFLVFVSNVCMCMCVYVCVCIMFQL